MLAPMPMPGAAPEGPPPGMPPAPGGGTGGAMAPAAMPGMGAQGMAAVKMAVEALQKALPALPMGSPLHGAALAALTGITKHMDDDGSAQGAGDKDALLQQLVQQARQGQQGGNPAAGAMPGAPPPPPPGAGVQ